jgi:hypothetical protein
MSPFFSRTRVAFVLLAACGGNSDGSIASSEDAGDSSTPGDAAADAPADAAADARSGGDSGLGIACSGASPTFSKDVAPILQRSCSGGELCHSGLAANPWPYKDLVNFPSTRDCASAGMRVVPSSLDASYIMHKLTGVGMCPGTDRMPRGLAPLPDAQIQTIADWICKGAQNN